MRRAGTLLLASIALISVVFVGAAAGHKAKYESTVTAKFNKPGNGEYGQAGSFDGNVNSGKRRCEKNRTVKVYMRAADGSTPLVGKAVTDAAGNWVLVPATPQAAGTYFAKAKKKVLRKNANHRHICRKAVSKDVKVK